MLAEGSRCPDQGIGPLNLQLRGEPRPPQHASLRPLWRGKIMPCDEMLSQSRQQRVPSIIADWDWLSFPTLITRHWMLSAKSVAARKDGQHELADRLSPPRPPMAANFWTAGQVQSRV
jgi:hypothetical protein